uniref:Conserved plasma membrane protein n=1 Tax=Panagrellus redivivus TaxID=6233 RepID=A0A7E4VMZ9_PANRE
MSGVWIVSVADLERSMKNGESYKFIRMADDFHNVANYLNDIRVCFISVTITIYVVLVVWAIAFCVRRNRRNVSGAASVRRPRSQWDYQIENQSSDYRNPGQTDDLVSVRSDGQTALGPPTVAPSYMGRNHRGAPTFMRHGLQMNHSSQTTRLVADHDGTVKHTIPSIANNGVAGNGGSSENSRHDRGDRDRGGGGATTRGGDGNGANAAKGKDAITDM